jgi:hypothetical protein
MTLAATFLVDVLKYNDNCSLEPFPLMEKSLCIRQAMNLFDAGKT